MNKRQRLLSDLKTGKKYPECYNCQFWIEQPYQIISPPSRKDSNGGFCPRCEQQKLETRYCEDLYVDNCPGCRYVGAWKIPVAGYELDLGFLPRVEFGRYQCLWKNHGIERTLAKEPYILVSKRSNLWVRGWKMEDEHRKYTCHRNQLQTWLDGLEASREVVTDWNKLILWEHLEWQSDELRAEEHQTDGGSVPLSLDSKTEGEDSQRPPSCVNPNKWNEALRREEKLINTFCVDSYHWRLPDSDFCSSALLETVPFREGYTRFTDPYFWRRPSYTFVSRYRGVSKPEARSEEANYKDSRIRGSAWKSDSKFFILSQRSDTYWARKKPFLHPPTYDLPFELDKQRKPIIVESPIRARNPRNVTPCKYPMNAPGNPNCRVGKGWDGATAKREMKWVGRMGLCWFNHYGANSKKYRKLGWTCKMRIVKNEWGYDEKQYYWGYDRKLARRERDIIRRQQRHVVSCQPPQPNKDCSLSRLGRPEPVISMPRGKWLCVCGWYHKTGTPCPSSSFERYWHRRYPSVALIKTINPLFPY